MFVTYRPEGSDEPQEWVVYPLRMRVSEQEAIERASGMSFGAWTLAVQSGSSTARRVLLWILMRREHPVVKLADVDFAWDELDVENCREEMVAMRDHAVSKGADFTAATQVRADAEIAAARPDPTLAGKALLPIVA